MSLFEIGAAVMQFLACLALQWTDSWYDPRKPITHCIVVSVENRFCDHDLAVKGTLNPNVYSPLYLEYRSFYFEC